jgi:hypothetical protein
MSTLAAVLLELRASIITLHVFFLNSFYISTKSGLDIEMRSILDLRDSKTLGYS